MRNEKDSLYRRAVHIAAVVMQADGLCANNYGPMKCRKLSVTEADCVACIEKWLIRKAKKEIGSELRKIPPYEDSIIQRGTKRK